MRNRVVVPYASRLSPLASLTGAAMRDRRGDERRWFRAQAIGWVRRPGTPADGHAFFDPFAESTLEILPRWADGLDGIEAYSHLVVLFWLDRAGRLRRGGRLRPEGSPAMPEVGVFATRSPRRPNPIGIACPRLRRREGNRLVVSGIDAWDGTPIIDLKGYAPRDECRPDATVPEWLTALWRGHGALARAGGEA